ncbi:hypothetical protein JB92DRAFT_3148976 [Gautieria morchelliformis]|nr:hypothetical protein JB92DRAFT_3148976 [Gautieria morchelliformis]
MSPNEIAFKFLSATLSRGVTRPPDDSYGDGEAWAQASRARSWHTSQLHPHLQRHSEDVVGLTRAGGDLSAESGATDATRLKSKRRGEDALENTAPAKRLRTCGHDPHVEAHMPTPTGLRFDASCDGMCASSSPLSKWQMPRTSPLGPRTSTYRRRSRESPQPSSDLNKPSWFRHCVRRNFYSDISMRIPDAESAQWCDDLHGTGLQAVLHPTYRCPHLYHPSDPEYDEEWPDESWSDEEWSDNEDTLPASNEDQVEADVRIITAEEPSQACSSKTFTFVHWNNWGASNSNMFHSPHSWDAPDSLGADAKERRGGALSETTGIVAAA